MAATSMITIDASAAAAACRRSPSSRSAFLGSAVPVGLFGKASSSSSLSRRSRTIVRAEVEVEVGRSEDAIKYTTDKYQVIQPINGDPFIAFFETPVTSDPRVVWLLSNLPWYRTAVKPILRGVEVGLAHGFFVVGPFVKTGPLRNTPIAGEAGSFAAAGLVVLMALCLTMYGYLTFPDDEPPPFMPTLTLSGRKKAADKLFTAEGWAEFTGGFFFGAVSGVLWAYLCLYVFKLPYPI